MVVEIIHPDKKPYNSEDNYYLTRSLTGSYSTFERFPNLESAKEYIIENLARKEIKKDIQEASIKAMTIDAAEALEAIQRLKAAYDRIIPKVRGYDLDLVDNLINVVKTTLLKFKV
jgi:hypothetical protein